MGRLGRAARRLWDISIVACAGAHENQAALQCECRGAAAAIASLEDVGYLMENVRKIVEERERLFAALEEVDFLEPVPSHANFLLCRVLGRPAAELKEELARQGILVRYFETPGLHEYVRISVGKPEETAALLFVLAQSVR